MKIPILNFPWICYVCKQPMDVVYPTTEEVYMTRFRGNLAPVYSKTMQKDVFGNLCPNCGSYQGNFFVMDNCLIENAYRLENYLVGFIDSEEKSQTFDKNAHTLSSEEIFGLINSYENSLDSIESDLQFDTSEDNGESYEIKKLRAIRNGPLIKCFICKKNTNENPEIQFQEHHLSYFPEKKITVCKNCHLQIHNTDKHPELKPKTKRPSYEQMKNFQKNEEKEQAKKDGTFSKNYCSLCEEKIKAGQSFTYYKGRKVHVKCLRK